jgi:MFS family permease
VAAAGVFAPERRALTIGILLAIAAFAVEGMGVQPALPTAVAELGGMPLFGWAFSAFMLAWLPGTVLGGLLADARGPRLPMAAGSCAFGAGLVIAGAAGGMTQFLAGRALQGAGGGAMIAAAYVAVARGYPDEARARMMALTASVWIVPALVGPALSGAVVEWLGWRYVFVGVAPIIALVALMVLPPLGRLTARRPIGGADVARLGAALRVAAGSGLVVASPSVYRFHRVAAVAALVVGVVLVAQALGALLPRGTLRARRGLPAGLALRGLLAFAFFGTEAFVPLGASALRDARPAQAGLALTAGALGWVAASWLQDRLEARAGAAGRAGRVRAGFLVLALGIAIVAAALLAPLSVWLAPVGWLVGGAGIGLSYSAGGLICFAAAPPGREGEVSGELQLAEALSAAAGTGLGGALLAALARTGVEPRAAYAAVFAVTFAVALAGAALAPRSAPAAPAAIA